MVDIPHIEDAEHVNRILVDYKAQRISMLSSEPTAFFFPRAVLITGPMHVLWNGFEHAVKRGPSWAGFKETLASILAFLGHKGLRDWFLQTCFDDGERWEHSFFSNWKHKVVDWKWEYMEECFVRLSPIIALFLQRFDEAKIKKPIGHLDATATTIDPNCMTKIKAAQTDILELSAMTESYAIFSEAVGREALWFTGCRCHDHIWQQPLTNKAKLRRFHAEVGAQAQVDECIWRGRRGSELGAGGGRWSRT